MDTYISQLLSNRARSLYWRHGLDEYPAGLGRFWRGRAALIMNKVLVIDQNAAIYRDRLQAEFLALEVLAARGAPISQCDEPHELITPTGAALLAEFVEMFGPMEGLTPERIGFGLGGRENKTRPNVVRAILGRSAAATAHDWETDTVAVLETNLDDANPEWLGHFMDQAMAAGALDVCQTPVLMKKNRPGVLLTVLCATAEADKFSEWILRHTSAFGVRRTVAERRKLRREFRAVRTPYGQVSVKIGRLDGRVVQTAPEYESCKKLAAEKNVPLKTVYEAALAAVTLESGPTPE